MTDTALAQALAHKVEAYAKHEGEYQLVMHSDTLIRILNDTKIGEEMWRGVKDDKIVELYGARTHVDDRVLVGAVNRRPC